MEKSTEKHAEAPDRGSFETVRAVLVAALIALFIRSFIVEPFKIPSGSMIPTLLVGDYVLVNKFAYGVRVPFTGALLIDVGRPERGDVMVFRYPDDPSQDFIKRVIGISGDRIAVRDGHVWVNGQPIDRTRDGEFVYRDITNQREIRTERFVERSSDGANYSIIHARLVGNRRDGPWIVPEGRFFMMGDNRDNSQDSRLWREPFVRAEQIKGRAFMIHWSWVVSYGSSRNRGFIADLLHTLWRVATFQVEEVRWDRIGRRIRGRAD
ncbi:MAG: signal peptidase I [Myxococcota bacterium]